MRSLRVAQVCADRGIRPGGTKGAAQHLRGIAAGLIELGHDVRTFAACPAEGPFPVDIEPIAELRSVSDVDVLYERYSLGHRDGIDRARQLGVPFVLEINAPLIDEAEAHRPGSVSAVDHAVEQHLLDAADLVIAVSTELSEWVRSRRSGPTMTQPNGFEPSWFEPDQSIAEHWSDREFPLVFLGHPKPWHGADRIATLLSGLATTGHRPRTLVIGGGPGAASLQAAADHHHVADQLTITGALPPLEATRRLRDAVIGLAPYPQQSPFYFCPLKVVDYLAAGLAVVSTWQGDVPELVGDAGIVVDDPDDDAAIVDAIRTLLDRDAMRAEMARAGRERARSTMTWTHVAANTAAAIDELVASRSDAGSSRVDEVVGR